MKTTSSSHEKSILIKSGVEGVDWPEIMTCVNAHISSCSVYAITLH